MPILRRKAYRSSAPSLCTTLPSTRIQPRSGASWPPISLSSVDLPLPLPPRIATTLPRGILRDRPRKIGNSPKEKCNSEISTRSSATKRLEQVRHRCPLRTQRLVARDLGGEQVALRVDHFELAGEAVIVAQPRQPQGRAERRRPARFGLEALPRAPLRRQGRAHLAERVLDGALIAGECLLLARLGRGDRRLQAAAGEDRLGERHRELPDAGRAAEQARQRLRLAAEVAR